MRSMHRTATGYGGRLRTAACSPVRRLLMASCMRAVLIIMFMLLTHKRGPRSGAPPPATAFSQVRWWGTPPSMSDRATITSMPWISRPAPFYGQRRPVTRYGWRHRLSTLIRVISFGRASAETSSRVEETARLPEPEDPVQRPKVITFGKNQHCDKEQYMQEHRRDVLKFLDRRRSKDKRGHQQGTRDGCRPGEKTQEGKKADAEFRER